MNVFVHIFFHIYAFVLDRFLEVSQMLCAFKTDTVIYSSKSYSSLYSIEQVF